MGQQIIDAVRVVTDLQCNPLPAHYEQAGDHVFGNRGFHRVQKNRCLPGDYRCSGWYPASRVILPLMRGTAGGDDVRF